MPEVEIGKIKRDNRYRKDFGDIEGLAFSINKYGLLHPVCVMKDSLILIAGERRIEAHVQLGKQKIEVKYFEDLDELERKEIEIEENIARKAFTWQEEVTAKLAIDNLKRLRYGSATKGHKVEGGWRQRDTAMALGQSTGTISNDIKLAEALMAYPELNKEKTKHSAFKKFKRLRTRDIQTELSKRHLFTELPFVYLGGCEKVMPEKIKPDSVDLIFTDPQFGIDLKSQSKLSAFTAVYKQDDSEHRVFNQLDLAFAEMHKVMKEGAHMYIFFAAKFYYEMRTLLEKRFQVSPTPLIWNKEKHSTPGGSKVFANAYEPFFFCSKGNPKELNNWSSNMFSVKGVPSDKRIHDTEKPVMLIRPFIEYSTLPGDTVLDPFAGSGSTLEAAIQLGRKAIGIDIDEVYYNGMLERLKEFNDDKSEGKKMVDTKG